MAAAVVESKGLLKLSRKLPKAATGLYKNLRPGLDFKLEAA